MYLVRDIFQCKPGKAGELAAKFKKTFPSMETEDRFRNCRVMVDAVELINASAGRVITMGLGKSGIICKKVSATLASTGTPSFFLHPAEAIHGDLGMIVRGDIVLAISNSGETEELLRLLPSIKRIGAEIVAITGNPQSSLAKGADFRLYAAISKYACPLGLAPTASTAA